MADPRTFESRLERALLRYTDGGGSLDAVALARTIAHPTDSGATRERSVPHDRWRWPRLALAMTAILVMAILLGSALVGTGAIRPAPSVDVSQSIAPSVAVPSGVPATVPAVSQASRAPSDGGLIAYCQGTLPDGQIHLREVDGSGDHAVFDGRGLRFSADGSTITYVTDWPDRTRVFVADPDGSNARELPDLGGDGGGQEHALSPDGRSMAWFDRRGAVGDLRRNGSIMGFQHPALRITSVDSGAVRTVLSGDEVRDPYVHSLTWAPDGQSIAFAGLQDLGNGSYRTSIYVIDVASGDLRRVSDRPGQDEVAIAWSPDSRRIAFLAVPDDALPPTTNLLHELVQDIFIIDADGTHEQHVTDAPGPERDPAWSPDGTRLAYLGHDGTAQRLMIAPVPGSPFHRSVLTGPVAESMAWSPDGAAIVYATGAAIATIDAGLAAQPVTLVGGTPTTCLSWQPDGR